MMTRNLQSKIRDPNAGAAGDDFFGFRIWNRFMISLVSCFLLAPFVTFGEETEHPFRFGFSTALMPEVNENDCRAAMKAWAETIVKNGVVKADPNVVLLDNLADMITAARNRAVDGLVATTTDYFRIQEQVRFNRCIFGVKDGSISDEYLLLVQQNSDLNKVEDLRGRSLNVLRQSQMCLATIWLDTLLLEQGLKPSLDFCGSVTDEAKLTTTVLPVFFHKADACLVTRKGFKTMCELNPQLSQQLRVLASSPKFVAAGFFFRAGYPAVPQNEYLTEFTRVQDSPAGQQILTVFQTERLEEHPAAVLDSAFALLERHRQLLGGTNSIGTHPTNAAQDEIQGAVK
jgi:ABC-type phosphate/phosphonate transport system substrate-binding protein